ncbi:MAG: DUF1127 domain-containing protein [Mesorhizobium sp.]|nr:MAG: DUF1127 domain-containing protein [Mesorhizobium sp.]RWK14713.1 MAG: DUF1127 domain-containing protein [Mesorhizobium sp.]
MEMTMTTFDHATCETSGTGFTLPGFAGRALRLAYHAMRMRSDRAALRAMPDYLLKDMGISRSQIEYYTSARGAPAEADRTDA